MICTRKCGLRSCALIYLLVSLKDLPSRSSRLFIKHSLNGFPVLGTGFEREAEQNFRCCCMLIKLFLGEKGGFCDCNGQGFVRSLCATCPSLPSLPPKKTKRKKRKAELDSRLLAALCSLWMSVECLLDAHRYYYLQVLGTNNLSVPPEFSLSEWDIARSRILRAWWQFGALGVWGRWLWVARWGRGPCSLGRRLSGLRHSKFSSQVTPSPWD